MKDRGNLHSLAPLKFVQIGKIQICLGFILLGSVPVLHAAYPLVVDDAGIHKPREMEVDANIGYLRGAATESVTSNLIYTTGLYPWLEGSIAFGYGWQRERHSLFPDERDGILDLNLGMKIPLIDETSAPVALTMSSTVVFPTAADGLGVEGTNFNFLLVATHTRGKLNFDANAGFNWAPGGGVAYRDEDTAFVGVAVRWDLSVKWMLFSETYASIPVHSSAGVHPVFRCGGQTQLASDLFLGLAIATGYGGAENAGLTVGITYGF